MVYTRAQVIPPCMEATEKRSFFSFGFLEISISSFLPSGESGCPSNKQQTNESLKGAFILGSAFNTLRNPPTKKKSRMTSTSRMPSPFPPQFEGGVSLGERFLGLMGLFPLA